MEGDFIRIKKSRELEEMKLVELVGRIGTIAGVPTVSGAWIRLDTPYLEEREWFIPSVSMKQLRKH